METQVCICDHTVLLAIRVLPLIDKVLSPVTTQPFAAVTHHTLAASHFTYPSGMEGCVNPPASGFEPGPLA
jgi:hypothetical protein